MSIQQYRDIYHGIVQFPLPVDGQFFRHVDGSVMINSDWLQADIQRRFELRFSYKHVKADSKWVTIMDDANSACICRRRYRHGGDLAAIKSVTVDNEEHEFLEVWSTASGLRTINEDLTACGKHGRVRPCDFLFGVFRWSPRGTQLLYVAETFQPKATSFFEPQPHGKRVGEEFLFADNWGEQLADVCHPVVCVFDCRSRQITVCDWLPENRSYGQPAWLTEQSLVVCGWQQTPYRLGFTYCLQRPSEFFAVDLAARTWRRLCPNDALCESFLLPTPCPDGKHIAFFEAAAGGPHPECCALRLMDLAAGSCATVLENVRWPQTDDDFPGLHLTEMPRIFWLTDDIHLLVSSFWRCEALLLLVNRTNGCVRRLRVDSRLSAYNVLDVFDDWILFTQECINSPRTLFVGALSEQLLRQPGDMLYMNDAVRLAGGAAALPDWLLDIQVAVLQHQVPAERLSEAYPNVDRYHSLVVYRSDLHAQQQALCVRPHGGPHSICAPTFDLSTVGLARAGYAQVLINYRGSQGAGMDSIDCLLGQIGTQDVLDCQAAAEHARQQFGFGRESKLVAFGGSHGGFLALHLVAQYPDAYRAAVLLNPVTNLPSMLSVTDIPDWVLYETGALRRRDGKLAPFEYAFGEHEKQYEMMRAKSPMSSAGRISAKCLFLTGRDDQRVPCSQALAMHRRLLACGVRSKLLEYSHNAHAIDKPVAEADWFINMLLWFAQ